VPFLKTVPKGGGGCSSLLPREERPEVRAVARCPTGPIASPFPAIRIPAQGEAPWEECTGGIPAVAGALAPSCARRAHVMKLAKAKAKADPDQAREPPADQPPPGTGV
jgi:hypothetical protein